jgi:hypothetical protein
MAVGRRAAVGTKTVQPVAAPLDGDKAASAAAAHADEVVFLADGRVVDLMAGPTAARVLDRMKALGG